MEESPPQSSLAWKEIKLKMDTKIVCKYLAEHLGRFELKPAEVAKLDEAKTDNNLKQYLHKLRGGDYWIVMATKNILQPVNQPLPSAHPSTMTQLKVHTLKKTSIKTMKMTRMMLKMRMLMMMMRLMMITMMRR